MITETALKFQRELRSLHALAIMNIAFGGVAMALAVSIGIQNILKIVETQSLQLLQFILGIVGFLVFGISMRWLISSAEILSGATDIRDSYEKKKTDLTDEDLTGLIVQMTAYYRENKQTIKRMLFICKIAGVCFLISGAINLSMIWAGMSSGASQMDILLQSITTLVSFGTAVASISISHFFRKYSLSWDHRLEETSRAEREFEKQLEGN